MKINSLLKTFYAVAVFTLFLGASAVQGITVIEENFAGNTLPSSLVAGFYTGGSAVVNNGLTLTTDGNPFTRVWVRTAASDEVWAGQSANITYDFTLASPLSQDAMGFLYLVGNDATDLTTTPEYTNPNVMGAKLFYESGNSTYSWNFYVKTNAANSGLDLPWLQIATITGITNTTDTLGFTINGSNNALTLFAGAQSANATIDSGVNQYFNTSSTVFFEAVNISGVQSVEVAGVSVVPEPSSVFLLVMTFAAIGVIALRRKNLRLSTGN